MRDIVPLFFDDPDPDEALKQLLARSLKETERLKVAASAENTLVGVSSNLPVGMTVEVKGKQDLYRVAAYCFIRKAYSLSKVMASSITGSQVAVPGSLEDVAQEVVTPYVWDAQDPVAEAQRAVDSHAKELVRLAALERCAKELPRAALNLPVGLPVKLLRPVTVPRSFEVMHSQTSGGLWGKMKAFASSFKSAPGCAAGDIAFVRSVSKIDGNYSLFIPTHTQYTMPEFGINNQTGCSMPTGGFLSTGAGVKPEDIMPLLDAAEDPQHVLEAIKERHEAELHRRETAKTLATRLRAGGFLNMPVGTPVEMPGKVPGVILRYASSAGAGAYVVKAGPDGRELSTVLATELSIALERADDAEALCVTLPARHEAEILRLKRAREANLLAVGLQFRLPVGAEVELDAEAVPANQWASLGRLAQITRSATILRRHERHDGITYDVLIGCWDQSGISSSAHAVVSAGHVRPVFWQEDDPMAALQRLCGLVGAAAV